MEDSERYRMDCGKEEKAKGCAMAAVEFVTIWQQFFYIFPGENTDPTDSLCDYVITPNQSRCSMLGQKWDGTLFFEWK